MKTNKLLIIIAIGIWAWFMPFLFKNLDLIDQILLFIGGSYIIGLGLFGLILNYKKQIIKFIGDIIYIRYYQETNLANKLLVIGFLRGIFGFKLFYYIDL